ncbi:MAG TPA: hypothetical protein DCM26_01350 [Desulfotomaculum sp.]|jgi:hypothetical protein|nr:hypothetical protein [Desulfotomaculum sp.]
MYPQTHVYFAEKVFGFLSPALVLGSIFPDIVAGIYPDRQESHGRGAEMLICMQQEEDLYDFARGVVTHGINPKGLDYYGDEKFLAFERGYCFEKGRPLVEETIRACNLPPKMGWWKSHNIIEMGIELHIKNQDRSRALAIAFANTSLIDKISEHIARFYATEPSHFRHRIHNFSHYIEISHITAESLASRYDVQMFTKHRLHIDTARVARLILRAAETVADDLDDFFAYTIENVRQYLVTTQC